MWMETETLRSIRARKATKVANAAKHDKAISFQPERSEDTAQIDDVELETNHNVQSTRPLQGSYATHGAMLFILQDKRQMKSFISSLYGRRYD